MNLAEKERRKEQLLREINTFHQSIRDIEEVIKDMQNRLTGYERMIGVLEAQVKDLGICLDPHCNEPPEEGYKFCKDCRQEFNAATGKESP